MKGVRIAKLNLESIFPFPISCGELPASFNFHDNRQQSKHQYPSPTVYARLLLNAFNMVVCV